MHYFVQVHLQVFIHIAMHVASYNGRASYMHMSPIEWDGNVLIECMQAIIYMNNIFS